MSAVYRFISQYFRTKAFVECLVALAIIAALAALIRPGMQWASSGSIRVPVRVFVFDATHGMPIADARVAIFRAPPLFGSNSLEDHRNRYNPTSFDQMSPVGEGFGKGTTEADGTVVIEYDFRTGASHRRPEPHAHLEYAWVHIHAVGLGGVVVPVRHESQPTATMRKQKELLVPVGLIRGR